MPTGNPHRDNANTGVAYRKIIRAMREAIAALLHPQVAIVLAVEYENALRIAPEGLVGGISLDHFGLPPPSLPTRLSSLVLGDTQSREFSVLSRLSLVPPPEKCTLVPFLPHFQFQCAIPSTSQEEDIEDAIHSGPGFGLPLLSSPWSGPLPFLRKTSHPNRYSL